MRDRLIELLRKTEINRINGHIALAETCFTPHVFENLADHLLASGVIVPPVRVGQTVWLVYSPKSPANPADKGKWFMRQDGVQRIIYGAKGLSVETWNMGTISAKEIRKKLFLSREAAEQALKGGAE